MMMRINYAADVRLSRGLVVHNIARRTPAFPDQKAEKYLARLSQVRGFKAATVSFSKA